MLSKKLLSACRNVPWTYLRQLTYSLKKFFMNFLGKFLTLEEIKKFENQKKMSIIILSL